MQSYLAEIKVPMTSYHSDRWKLIRKYAGAQTLFTGSGIPGEDGVGVNRAIRLKDQMIGEDSITDIPVAELRVLIYELKKLYKELIDRTKSGETVPGDIKGYVKYENKN